MNNDPRYSPIDATLPPVMPPVTRAAILPYYHKLIRAFGGVAHIPEGVHLTPSGKQMPITSLRERARACWASTQPTRGHDKGWGRMIHDASHYVFRKRHPNARPHDGGHATLEREMAQYAVAHGFFEVKPDRVSPKPTDAEKIAAIEARVARWESKRKRAETAIKKLNRKLAYYRRKQS